MTEIGSSKTIYKYVVVWWDNIKIRAYPSTSLGDAMREAKDIIRSGAFTYFHEISVCPFDLFEKSGECQNLLARENVITWYKEARPWYKDSGIYTPPKDQRRDQRGLSPHPYPAFVPHLIPDEERHRLPYFFKTESPVVQKIVSDHERKREGIEKFLDHGSESYRIKVSREDGSEEKAM